MAVQEVRLENLTRREFREALEQEKYRAAIIPTGSIEQHLEHLPVKHDIASATYVAVEAAKRMYPRVIVVVPMAVGISEHHMEHRGTITAKPGSWLSLLFDAVESLVRHGIQNVLILNGHGGNEAPVYGIIRQWQLYFQSRDPAAAVQFESYWNLSREDAEEHCSGRVPGHAQEYETSFSLAVFPETVRLDAMHEQGEEGSLKATAELGRVLVDLAITRTAEFVQGMLEGRNRDILGHIYSRELYQQLKGQ